MRIPRFPSAVLLPLLLLALPLQAADWQYLTVPGDTLIGIGRQYLQNPNDWPKVQAENGVSIPERLPVNTHLRIPVGLLKLTPAPVRVTAVNGNVRFKAEGGGFKPLKSGDQLNGGESVLTGPRSSASYRFADGTTLTQQASSKLSFGRLAAYGKTGMVATEVSLDDGRVEARAAKQVAPAGGFKVRTPVAVAGLRGTEFRINVMQDEGRMYGEVASGEIEVSAQGKTVTVAAGEGTFTEAGKPPAPVRALLPPPDLSALPERILRLPISLTWPIQPGAASWRVRLATDSAFENVLLDDMVNRPMVEWSDALPDGDYLLRIRAIDPVGMEGMDAQRPLVLDVHPLAPLALNPVLGEQLVGPQVQFRWSGVPDARGYVLQIAPTAEFTQGLIEQRLDRVEQHVETLGEGKWHWRLASLDADGQQHPFSAHRAFQVKSPANAPVPPTNLKIDALHGPIIVSWQGQAPRYRIELALSGNFANPLLVQEHDRPSITLSGLMPGNYQLRVMALGADGSASQPGPYLNFIVIPYTPYMLLFVPLPGV